MYAAPETPKPTIAWASSTFGKITTYTTHKNSINKTQVTSRTTDGETTYTTMGDTTYADEVVRSTSLTQIDNENGLDNLHEMVNKNKLSHKTSKVDIEVPQTTPSGCQGRCYHHFVSITFFSILFNSMIKIILE